MQTIDLLQYKFKPGDKVFWTNGNGVDIGVRTVCGLCPFTYSDGKVVPTYYLDKTDAPWFPTFEEHLRLATKKEVEESSVVWIGEGF